MKHLTVVMICLSAGVSFGGAITSTTTAVGTSYTAVIGGSSVKGIDLTNSFALVTFSDASQASCFFGNGTGVCTSLGNFSLFLNNPPGDTNSSGWMISNLKIPGTSITTIDINVLVGTNPVGFDLGSISGITGGAHAGTSSSSATALLTDALHTSGQTPGQATEYARLVLTFSNFLVFNGAETFGFGASNHFITSAVPDVVTPEPATYIMVGLALAGFGTLKFKRRKPLKKL